MSLVYSNMEFRLIINLLTLDRVPVSLQHKTYSRQFSKYLDSFYVIRIPQIYSNHMLVLTNMKYLPVPN